MNGSDNEMNENINSFQDLIREEFEIEETVLEDDFNESMDMLDIVMTENDEKRVEFMESEIDSFINDIDLKIEQIVKEEREQNMDILMDFFDEDAEVFEEMMDAEIEDLEAMQYNEEDGDSIDDEGDMIDAIEGLPYLDGEFGEE